MKFVIRLKGENYGMERIKRDWLLRKRICQSVVGFYTTRFVEADNANLAIEKATRIVSRELEGVVAFREDSTFEIESVEENSRLFDQYAPGRGFTFFVDDRPSS
jgi:hypothetical protein